MSRVHKHMIATFEVDLQPKKDYLLGMKKFIQDLVKTIDMKLANVAGNPITWYCEDEGNEGMTVVAVITTSHIAMHFWPDTSELQFDLYSCKDYDEEQVVNLLDYWFQICKTRKFEILIR